MKRDLDLQREILIKIEETDTLLGLGFFDKAHGQALGMTDEEIEGVEDITKEVRYSLDLLLEAQFVRRDRHGVFEYYNLTNTGHTALDAIRDAGFWNSLRDVTPKKASEIITGTLSGAAASGVLKILGLE